VKPLTTSLAWIDARYHAGAKQIGVTCNPVQRKLYLTADGERLILDCPTMKETRILKDIIHDHIARLPAHSDETSVGE
jgi:hypothetical protein